MPAKKPGIIRVPSEDVETQKEGWVEMSAYLKAKHLPYVIGLQGHKIADESISAEERAEALSYSAQFLAKFVTDWNWKDPDGTPYPNPADNPEFLEELQPDEFRWLMSQANQRFGKDTTVPKQNTTPS